MHMFDDSYVHTALQVRGDESHEWAALLAVADAEQVRLALLEHRVTLVDPILRDRSICMSIRRRPRAEVR